MRIARKVLRDVHAPLFFCWRLNRALHAETPLKDVVFAVLSTEKEALNVSKRGWGHKCLCDAR